MRKQVSQRQIADKLGINQRTVSFALNGTGRISDDLRAKILETAKKLGYRHNPLAAGLRGSKTHSIGIVWSFSDPWAGDSVIALDITQALQEKGYAVYQALHDNDTSILAKRIDDLLDRSVDALIVQALPYQLTDTEIQVRLASCPTVTVCREAIDGLSADQIIHDRTPAIQEVVTHFAQSGRRKPCMILDYHQESNPSKYAAFVAAWATHGIPENSDMLVDLKCETQHMTTLNNHENYSIHGELHRKAFSHKFPNDIPVDCIFCFNDVGALYIMRELHARGIHIPEDIAVVGFNNNQVGAVWNPPLASGDRCTQAVSTAVLKNITRRLKHPKVTFTTHTIPMKFIWRESAGLIPHNLAQ